MSSKRYSVIIERTSTGFSAYSPDVAGCAAVGDTEDETRRNFREALEFHFEGMKLAGEPIPESSTSVDYVEVPRSTPLVQRRGGEVTTQLRSYDGAR